MNIGSMDLVQPILMSPPRIASLERLCFVEAGLLILTMACNVLSENKQIEEYHEQLTALERRVSPFGGLLRIVALSRLSSSLPERPPPFSIVTNSGPGSGFVLVLLPFTLADVA